MLKIAICEDSEIFVEIIKKNIETILKVPYELHPYLSGKEFMTALPETRCPYDIVFLDIEMPNKSGIFVGRELKKNHPDIIIFIITSYVEYLDDAMRFQVFRYLLKPLDKQRLFRNMKDVILLYNSTNIKVSIETKGNVYTINVSDIIFVEAQGRAITIYTPDRNYVVVNNMAYWVHTLNMPCFFQSHRSFIVNMKYVSEFNHSLIHLYDNKYTAYLTKRKYSQFKDAYFLYLESTR